MVNGVRKYVPITNAKSFESTTSPDLLVMATVDSRSYRRPHLLMANLEFKEVTYVVHGHSAEVGFEPRSIWPRSPGAISPEICLAVWRDPFSL